MQLYEHRDESGHVVEWWTEWDRIGIYFSIKQLDSGRFAVLLDGFKKYAICNTFPSAERKLREAESEYENTGYWVGLSSPDAPILRPENIEPRE